MLPDLLKENATLPKEQVAHIFQFTVLGDHNVIAPQSSIGEISFQAIDTNDIQSLALYLQTIGLSADEVGELEEAITGDGKPEKEKFGKRVTDWIGRVVGNAVSGTWKTTLATAPGILKEALFRYYGWK